MTFENAANVYRSTSTRIRGKRRWWAGDFQRPNGLCFSPDESRLYIVDTGRSDGPEYPTHIRVFRRPRRPPCERAACFADMGIGSSDGVRTDVDGNLWSGACWGGRGLRRRTLFCSGRHLDRQDPPASALRQSMLRRREKEPAVHNLFAVAVLGVRRDERGSASRRGLRLNSLVQRS